jgi:hypothetical protein
VVTFLIRLIREVFTETGEGKSHVALRKGTLQAEGPARAYTQRERHGLG